MNCEECNPTILFAEDDKELMQMYTRALKDRHLNIETAGDGREALGKVTGKRYDIMLLDIMMPIKSGIEVIRELPEICIDTHIIILSNLAATDVPVDIRSRANRYIVKAETTPSKLADVICEVAATFV